MILHIALGFEPRTLLKPFSKKVKSKSNLDRYKTGAPFFDKGTSKLSNTLIYSKKSNILLMLVLLLNFDKILNKNH